MKNLTTQNDNHNLELWQNLEQVAQDVLDKSKKMGADNTEVSIAAGTGISASVRLGKVDNLEYNRDKGIAITVYKGNKKGNVTTSDITSKSIDEAIASALKIATITESDPCNGLADQNLLAKEKIDLDLYHPEAIDAQQAIDLAKQCESYALNFDKRITNSDGASFNKNEKYLVYANSNGFLGAYPSTSYSLSCVTVAEDKNGMQRDYDYSVARKFTNLNNIETIGEHAAKATLSKLGARKIKTCKSPVIFSAKLASGLLANFISAISGANLYRKTSFLLDSINTKIFPDFVSMQEDPFVKGGLGSAYFDSDGIATNKKYILENGIVKSYLLSNYSAKKLNMQPTGNGGGVHNLLVSNSNLDFHSLVKSMGTGLLVTELMGHGINLVTGDYSRGAFGYWIENGEVQYPVQEITIAGNLKDMFKNIVSISNDIDKRANILSGSILVDSMSIAGN